jgi:hypothetical protein
MSFNAPNNFLFLFFVNLGYITNGMRVEAYNTWTSGKGQISLFHFIFVKETK